jgi:hypothetical protein
MDEKHDVTIDASLAALSDALGKASTDLRAAVPAIDRARAEIATRNTSLSRSVVADAEKVIDHLRKADECLRDVVKDLAER